jgi:hypothetical protein
LIGGSNRRNNCRPGERFPTGGFQAASIAVHTATLEIKACSAAARIKARPFRDRSFIAGAIAYFLFVSFPFISLFAADIELTQPHNFIAPRYTRVCGSIN